MNNTLWYAGSVRGAARLVGLTALMVTLGLGVPASTGAQGRTPVELPARHEVMAIVSEADGEVVRELVDIPSLIVETARRWELDENVMLRVAWCESRWNPDAVGYGGNAGLFQFAPVTWGWVSEKAGYPGTTPHHVIANVEAAAWLYKNEGDRHWGCR